MGHVVAVAHVTHLEAFHLPKVFIDGLQVGQHLTGMQRITQAVDDWDRCVLSQLHQVAVGVDARHHDIAVS